VDEFILQIDAQDNPIYMLQDANLNVVALYGFNSLTGAYGVLRQDVYTPYGELAATDLYTQDLADSKVGFQGLFYNRLATSAQDTQLAPGAIGLYNARNRPYGPHVARFFTRDPNGTSQLVIGSAAYHAGLVYTGDRAFVINELYGDGSNLYQFVRSNPVNVLDPLGLWGFDYFDEAEAFEAEHTGWRLYAVGALNEGARIASLGLQTALNIGSALLGLDVLESVKVLLSGQGGFWESLDIVMAVNPIGKVAKIAGTVAGAATFVNRTAKAGKIAGTLLEHVGKILPARQARQLTKGFEGKIQAHHLLEKRFAELWDGLNPDEIPAVILPRKAHEDLTAKLFSRLPTNRTGEFTKAEVWAAYQEVYTEAGAAQWLQHIEHYFR
jgi:hypothetical protein